MKTNSLEDTEEVCRPTGKAARRFFDPYRRIRIRDDRGPLLKRRMQQAARIGALALFVAVAPGHHTSAQAGTSTANLTVQITITASCTINAATLNFGSVAGTTLATTLQSGSTTVSVTCTNGSPYSIAMDNGANVSGSQRRMANAGNFINYDLYTDSAHTNPWTTATSSTTCTTTNGCILGTGSGSAQTINIYGTVPATGTAPNTGTYTDTVVMTITY
ncbi:spore coat U domain-containing protein [Bradyrhizobium acaciae]|uniref:Csu type fimbrial protein n=1 Tax=Bradyrhizobium acaciae TaxID=2683706 RepID=UPI001E46DABA|nr:spore coat U domain-containing protein [Bradyrhizobium acaciae]MCC8979283.1 spore coat protein U domain-containing protein [Bradyrhizobium acaciae]